MWWCRSASSILDIHAADMRQRADIGPLGCIASAAPCPFWVTKPRRESDMQKLPIGLATQAGLSTTVTAYVVAIIAFIQGDRTEETIGALVAGTVALLSVIFGRYAQATAQIKSGGLPGTIAAGVNPNGQTPPGHGVGAVPQPDPAI
jgi:hypothetical protein